MAPTRLKPLTEDDMRQQYRNQKSALTRAVNSGDPQKVRGACMRALAEWARWPHGWPDDWHRWNIALEDATGGYPRGQSLDELRREMIEAALNAERAVRGRDYVILTEDYEPPAGSGQWSCHAISVADALAQWQVAGQPGVPVAVYRADVAVQS